MLNLKKQKIWVCWKYARKNGHMSKKPFSISGIPTGSSEDHRSEWSYPAEALEAFQNPENGFDGTGFIMPKGYFLLDVDHKDEDDPVLKDLLRLFPTYLEISPSGNGYHFYGKCDLDRIPQKWDAKDNRWKVDGKYYVKNTKSGLEIYIGGLTNRFATYTGNLPDLIPPCDPIEEIKDCTDSVLEFLEKYMKKPEEAADLFPVDPSRYITLSEENIPEIIDSLRSQKNAKKFTSLFDDGIVPAGLSQSEADASLCAMIAFRAGPNPELIDAIFQQSALYRSKWDRPDYKKATIDAGIRSCRGVFHHDLIPSPPFVLYDGKREYIHPALLADYAREHLDFLLVREAIRGSYHKYVYSDGCYRDYNDDMFKGAIKAFVEEYNRRLVWMPNINEAFSQIMTDLNYIPQTDLNTDEDIINFQNGLLDLPSMTLKPHDPAVLSTIQIPCDWTGKDTPTPVFDRYLDTLSNSDPAIRTFLLEFMGAALSNVKGSRMKKSLFIWGPGDSGKSQLKRLTEKLLGSGNYASIDLSQMEARFGTSAIYSKRLAGSSDMSFMTVSELKTFKQATGGDSMFIEYKGRDSFEFEYRGLLWFCMNQLPKFGGDDGQWVYDRIVPVHCPNVIPVEERDSRLLDKMYEEREGIVYKAVMAFKEVISRGYRFTETDTMSEARKDYQVENNTALEFFETCMQRRIHPPKSKDPYTVSKVYKAYCWWYEACYGKAYRKSKKEFFRAIADSLGTSYEDMICENTRGTILKDYCPDPNAWEEYDLSSETFDDIRRWVA